MVLDLRRSSSILLREFFSSFLSLLILDDAKHALREAVREYFRIRFSSLIAGGGGEEGLPPYMRRRKLLDD